MRGRWVPLVGLLGLGCGESGDASNAGGVPGTGGSSSGASTGGTSSGGVPAGGSGGSAVGGGASGSSVGGSSGGSGGTVTQPTALPNIACAAGEVVYEGTVGGIGTAERLPMSQAAGQPSSGAYSGGTSIGRISDILDDEKLLLSGGILMFPEGSAHAGKVWCINSGLLGRSSNPSGALVGHLLGQCPGSPVEGTMYACADAGQGYCAEGGAPEKRRLGGQLKGAEVTSPGVGLTSLSARSWVSNTERFDFALFADAVPSTTVVAGLKGVLLEVAGAGEGDVYCVGGGEWKRYSDNFVTDADVATLSQISYLGSCKGAGANEALNVCIGL